MLETRWHLIRHAPVDNPDGRIYGASDKSANTSNARAFQVLAQRLPRKGIAITSHLKRTQQTLDALVSGGLEVSDKIIENRLGEQDFGDWTGKTYEEARSIFGDAYDKFWITPAKAKPPNQNGKEKLEFKEKAFKQHQNPINLKKRKSKSKAKGFQG